MSASVDSAVTSPARVSDAEMATILAEILDDPDLPRAIWGIHVQDLTTSRTLLARNADLTLLPASTMKLLTTATALDALGPDFRYTTQLFHFGDEVGGTLRGDLVIRGAGDPTFGSEWVSADPLKNWAEALYEAGVRRVEGRIIGDDDRFEDAAYAEGWDVSHIATESYAPASGGLAWGDNLMAVRFRGGEVSVDPPGFVEFVTDLAAERRGGGRLRVGRTVGTNKVTLSGTIQLPVENPTLYAATAFADRLADAGIAVDAAIVDVDEMATAPSYEGAEPLRAYVSPPLREIVQRINRKSDNLYAEHLFRTLSSNGSTEASARRVKDFLASAGAQTDGLNIVDGSGLSRKDMITPEAMGALLARMNQHPASGAFRQSLPQGGGAGSTLRNRMRNVPVRAKTGSLQAVRALAGYVEGPRGQTLAFVLMANNYTAPDRNITQAMDRIVDALASGERPPADEE
ncbi:D-alanyl-D-alanine carboxypeptidase/D-alanyl-D-alanine-endopeptidase [Rubricoccus marinus]|uniref:D-alanyl-D-alanine carboxypeptidase/D-alanyl-D-alanine-endopeptidase n=1 Tax=Rubricoccus marinus TaxID=716817 RepID=A0A259U452_9BACT|nr:D-alanyl-D-alanine carboxypeptidase/D-alanyl-D-alanine-endopeptidase [Rubricoccus marinus]